MLEKQCTCGRSKLYPYCDNTHKIKISKVRDEAPAKKVVSDSMILHLDEPEVKPGFNYNRIVEIPNFIESEEAQRLIDFLEDRAQWGHMPFYGSLGQNLRDHDHLLAKHGLSDTYFSELMDRLREKVELGFDRKVKNRIMNAQKWREGAYAVVHSDNSDYEGVSNPFEEDKFAGVLYLNDDYEGGELYFPGHKLAIKPKAYSFFFFPGGVENLHGVNKIESGVRHTIMSFWDFAEAEYSQEKRDRWAAEIKSWIEQAEKVTDKYVDPNSKKESGAV